MQTRLDLTNGILEGLTGLSFPREGGEAMFELFVSLHISLSEVYTVTTKEFILAMKIQQVALNP